MTRLIVTCMRNEGPFILEWVSYHRSIGFTDFVVYTNDCDDGTVELLDTLARHGVVTRIDNPFRAGGGDANPQHSAFGHAETLDSVARADWILISDVDEFVNVHAGDGTLDALFAAAGPADCISMQWRLFGNGDVAAFRDGWVTEQFTHCAPEFVPDPIQAWAVKTLFRTDGPHVAGRFRKFGVHRPLKPGRGATRHGVWLNGSAERLPETFVEKGWRLGTGTYGYGLVSLNHYAVRSAESFLVKRDRGRVNHVNRDQGAAYWMRMNFNMERDGSILRHLPRARAELAALMALPGVAQRHADCVAAHRAKIAALLAVREQRALFDRITSDRLRLISRHLNLLDREMLAEGPDAVPDELVERMARVPDLPVTSGKVPDVAQEA